MIEIGNKKFYTTKEVAEKLGIGVNRVSQLRNENKIKAEKLGPKKFIFSEQNIIDYLEGNYHDK